MAVRTLRIFVSSPGDVGQERLIATRVIERLNGEFGGYVDLEPILWEHEPLRATSHFQEQIVPPSQTDIVICILWSRLGTRLPEQFRREDGSFYASGTEWEFEDSLRAFLEKGTPDLMVYRKTAETHASMNDEQALMQRLQQKKALETFIDRWFGNAQSTFKAAFHNFDTPDQFEEVLDSHLRTLIRERLPKHIVEGDATTAIVWHKGSPYRGLEAFDVEHAPVFFGRTRAIGEIKDALVQRAASGCAFVLVFGMSGSGKSSLVRAGLLPTLAQPGVAEGIGLWRWAIFRPSDAPSDVLGGLAHSLLGAGALPELADDGMDAAELGALLREAPERAVGPLRMGLKHAAESTAREENLDNPPEARLAVVLDQMEEIFTVERIDADERNAFVAAISALSRSGLVWVIGTMRSDFYPRCREIPELVALKEGQGQYDLLPPSFSEIGQMIRKPTRAAGLQFEVDPQTGERLDDVIHSAAAHDPEALPLLEFTLEQLYQEVTDTGVLTFAAYHKLNGLEGALAQRAEDVFLALEPQVQAVLPDVLRALVAIEGDGDLVARRRVPLASLTADPARMTLLNAFVAARLLVMDRADDGESVVGVAHEALLRHWPRLQQWLEEDREFLRTRERIAAAEANWRRDHQLADCLLPEGKHLAEAVDLLERRRSDLSPNLVTYIETSRRKWIGVRRRKLVTAVSVVTAFFAVTLGFGLFSYREWQRAQTQKDLALQAIDAWSHDIPDKLKDVPGTLPVLKVILEKNVGILDKILQLNPGTPSARREKALNYERSGDTWRVLGATGPALEAYEKSFAILTELAQDETNAQAQRDLSVSYEKIGDVQLEMGNDQKALELYQKDAALAAKLAHDPTDAGAQRDLSVSYEKTGTAWLTHGDTKQALEAYEKSLAVRVELAKTHPDAQAQRDLAVSYEKIGTVWMARGDNAKALDSYDKSLQLRLQVLKAKPSLEAKRDVAIGYTNLGDVRRQMGALAAAVAAYGQSHAIFLDLGKDRLSVQAQRDLAISFNRLGDLRLAMGQNEAALEAYQRSLAIATEVAKDKSNVQAQQYLVEMCGNLAWAELLSRHPHEAIIAAKKGLALDPTKTWIRVNLAHALLFDNQYEKAMVMYLKNEDTKIDDKRTFGDVVLADFKQFRQKGLVHPNMAQIERLIIQARQ